MSVQRIDNPAGRTHGWQARVYFEGTRYWSAFFADRKHGKRKAKWLAQEAEDDMLKMRGRFRDLRDSVSGT